MNPKIDQCQRPTLKRGAQNPFVQELQLRLSQQIRPLDLTGHFDYETEIVVKHFQSQLFLMPDGIVGPSTWQAIYTQRPVNRPSLCQGDTGQDVEALQELLSIDLYYPGFVDGRFGSLTRFGVERFQRDQELPVNGKVDQSVWQRLSQI